MHPDTVRQMEREAEYVSQLKLRISQLEQALKCVVGHWDEFGYEDGMDEAIERARKALRRVVNQTP